ncbi:heterocyst formation ABC transporter subunit HepA [Leptolyngbya sp. NIES-2104]|uniref:heterocyst formation ABC transporter subunit HepA n=1 Tax=Leptolyngbya sp. NIES-2104 TaxID=1552121 RepID=UPI0006EC63BC|nr:heterocyst formation ABC transporter subunit HepA [Leptolyngbya sp. NIES-2104]GAP99190.1 lipid A export ATP-binding/permease protein MsbA [Leptolyngbya sp. NIES-2104]
MPRRIKRIFSTTRFWQEYGFIFREFKFFPRVAIAAMIFAIGSAAFEGFGFGFLLAFLQNLVSPTLEPFRTGFNWFDVWILGVDRGATERLLRVSSLILLSAWIRAGFNYFTQVYTDLAQQRLVDRLRRQVFEQLQAVNLSYFNRVASGELINTITTEIGRLNFAFALCSFIFIRILTLILYSALLFTISWQLTIISLALFGVVAIVLSRLNDRVRSKSVAVSAANGRFTSTALELINGIRTVQAFATQDYERKRFYTASSEVVKAGTKATRQGAIVRPLAEGLATTILIVMIILAITVFVENGTLQTASLLTFLFILFRLVPAIHEVNGSRVQLISASGSIRNLRELLRRDDKPYLHEGDRTFKSLNHAIEFCAVDFGYDPDQLVLKEISLCIPKGHTTAIVGGSGAGKSTLVDLIPRFYDPTFGKILFDGEDARSFTLESLRKKMAIVSQDTFIFNTSVRDNIAYGLEDMSDQQIWQAAEQANALDFILELPEQFATVLGDRGMRLSGGQRQRLAIARALLRDPEILILDEATSALDSESEQLIQQSLERLSAGRTVITIAHRLSTIVRADQVVVMEQGQIVEQGSYQTLLEKRGRLWQYHRIQHELRSG